MTHQFYTSVHIVNSEPARRGVKFQWVFEQRFLFALTLLTADEDVERAILCVAAPQSYFEFRDQWLGSVYFGPTGTIVRVNEMRPDYSYCEVETHVPFDEPDFEDRILGLFQEVIDLG